MATGASGGAFPAGFTWGAASSSYQIEGAATADGKGPSIWDSFCRHPGAVHQGDTGDVACDHYHRMPEDAALMAAMGLQAYRFSVSWPRVMPEGTGKINEAGLGFYDRLVDALLARGIEPWVTLFHWDYPLALYHRGGWLNRETAAWFAEYAQVVVDRLSDRVRHWMTINEPQIFIGLGHLAGINAPGLKLQTAEWLLGAHHSLLSHGRAAQVIRARAKTPPRVGWAPIGWTVVPATDSAADIDAARRAAMGVRKKDCWNNTWFADPVCLGRYPEDGLALFGADAPSVQPGDMEVIRQPLDFYGLNIYSAEIVRAGKDGAIETVPRSPGYATNALRWPLEERALYWGPRFVHERYKTPIYITENGMTNLDWVSVDGKVHDPQRIDYTTRYLRALRRAINDGVDCRGYFHWSVMDNFEWAEGYKDRFGLIHVDYATLKRTPKESAAWYRTVIESNGRVLES
jgi:beta-glucosidase